MKSTDFIKEAPVQYSTTFQGAPESHPMYNTYYQQELAKRKNLPSGEQTAAIMAANRVKADMAKAGTTAFPAAPGQQMSAANQATADKIRAADPKNAQPQQVTVDQAYLDRQIQAQAAAERQARSMTGSKTDPRNPPGNGPTIPQPAPVATPTTAQPTGTVPDETDDMRGGQSQATPLPAGGFKAAAARPTTPTATTNTAAVGADPMQPVAQPASQTATSAASTPAYQGSKGAQAIMALNPDKIKNVNNIRVGDTIKLPDGSNYTIVRGDTLDAIAAGRGRGSPAAAAPINPNNPQQGRGNRSTQSAPPQNTRSLPTQNTQPVSTAPNSPTARSPGMQLPRPGGPMPRDIPREPGPLSPQMPPSASAVLPTSSMKQALDVQTGNNTRWAPSPISPKPEPGSQANRFPTQQQSQSNEISNAVARMDQVGAKQNRTTNPFVMNSKQKPISNLVFESYNSVSEMMHFKSILTEAPRPSVQSKIDTPAYQRKANADFDEPAWNVTTQDLNQQPKTQSPNSRLTPNASGDLSQYNQSSSQQQTARPAQTVQQTGGRVEPRIPPADGSSEAPKSDRKFKVKQGLKLQPQARQAIVLAVNQPAAAAAEPAISAGIRQGSDKVKQGLIKRILSGAGKMALGLGGWGAVAGLAWTAYEFWPYVREFYEKYVEPLATSINQNTTPGTDDTATTSDSDKITQLKRNWELIKPYVYSQEKFDSLTPEDQRLVIEGIKIWVKETGEIVTPPVVKSR